MLGFLHSHVVQIELRRSDAPLFLRGEGRRDYRVKRGRQIIHHPLQPARWAAIRWLRRRCSPSLAATTPASAAPNEWQRRVVISFRRHETCLPHYVFEMRQIDAFALMPE